METKLIGPLTEIYIGGGDLWITEAFPTYFHTFSKRRILTAKDSMENYKEVTASQKATLESEDAAYERPPQAFIEQWNKASHPRNENFGTKYGEFNESTGYFELNGLTDITYRQALDIYRVTAPGMFLHCGYYGQDIRTNFYNPSAIAIWGAGYDESPAPRSIFCGSSIEVARIFNKEDFAFYVPLAGYFRRCRRLKKVIGILTDDGSTKAIALTNDNELEEIWIRHIKTNLNAPDSPNLKPECIEYAVDNAAATNPISFILHPEAYARLTDELKEKAAAKKITFVTN